MKILRFTNQIPTIHISSAINLEFYVNKTYIKKDKNLGFEAFAKYMN